MAARTKTDLRPEDVQLLGELARAIGIQSRTEANHVLIPNPVMLEY